MESQGAARQATVEGLEPAPTEHWYSRELGEGAGKLSILEPEDLSELVQEWAGKLGCTIVLKNNETFWQQILLLVMAISILFHC